MKRNFWRNKKVIITGANGFVASHLTLSLLNKGAVVIGIIKEKIPSSFLDIQLRKRGYPNLKIQKADIVNFSFVKRLIKRYKPDICFHIAAQAIVGCANKSPIPTFKTNIEGTWNILEAVRQFSPATKVIVA